MRRSPARSWASDLVHPLPLAAVALLVLNDHALKGSGLLPGAITGKLSDVAGLFFFPLLLTSLARGAARLAGRDLDARRALAVISTAATGLVFTLLKFHGPFNAFMTSVWGVNTMDASDIFALPVLLLSAAFMLRHAPGERGAAHPARRVMDFAAVGAAALAAIATSPPPPPPPQHPPPPPAPPQRVGVAAESCVLIEASGCVRSSTMTYVVVEATGLGPGPCSVEIHGARERAARMTPVDMLPAPVRVDPERRATFSLTFLRPISQEEQSSAASITIDASVGGGPAQSHDFTLACRPR